MWNDILIPFMMHFRASILWSYWWDVSRDETRFKQWWWHGWHVMMASNYVAVSGVLCAGNTCMGSRYGWVCAYKMGIYLAPRNSPRHWYYGQCACLCQVAGFSPSQMTSIVFFSALSHVFLISFFRFIFVLK